MRIHLIAIGGSAMHNIALALKANGHDVTGSDDEIYDPARTRLEEAGLLPDDIGWDTERIHTSIDLVILGMHARSDNPELARALELGVKVYSYPEFVYEMARDKQRVVIAGSHGKTTTTSMIMHVLKETGADFDYLVGAQIPGFEHTARFSDAPLMVIEGDEYLSSCLDRRPKFLHYRANIAVLTGIAWDHINVFPEFETYKDQFRQFIESMDKQGQLFYYAHDSDIADIMLTADAPVGSSPYSVFPDADERHYGSVLVDGEWVELEMFGRHNLENMNAAFCVCASMGVSKRAFIDAIKTFSGASRRLQKFIDHDQACVFFDFAHAPSKVKASIQAVKLQYHHLGIRALLELHTFSSLNKAFLQEYAYTMREADEAIVFYDEHTLAMKRMPALGEKYVREAFMHDNLKVFTQKDELQAYLEDVDWGGYCSLFMSSGNFMKIPVKQIATKKIDDHMASIK